MYIRVRYVDHHTGKRCQLTYNADDLGYDDVLFMCYAHSLINRGELPQAPLHELVDRAYAAVRIVSVYDVVGDCYMRLRRGSYVTA